MQHWLFIITPGLIPQQLLEKAFYAGWGRVPCRSLAIVRGNILEVQSETPGSGTIQLPLPYPDFGIVMDSTESLAGRDTPYLLLRELCRGALGRMTRRLFDWSMLGFRLPDHLREAVRVESKRFANAVVKNIFEPNLENDFLSIMRELIPLNRAATKAFTEQSVTWRMRVNEQLPVRFGAYLETLPVEKIYETDLYAGVLDESFHCVFPMPSWRELEPIPGHFDWERVEHRLVNMDRYGKEIFLGPLISFTPENLPQWLLPRLDEDGFLETRVVRFVNSMAERYGYLAGGWYLANRFHTQSFPNVLQSRMVSMIRFLAVQLRSRGIETPIIVGVDQPWGEYALHESAEWRQVQLAEALMGCREIDAFMLEINLGAGKNLTLPWSPMTISNMIDQWSFLGKKIFVSISVPSAGTMLSGAAISDTASENEEQPLTWSNERQQFWTDTLLYTLLGKRMIHGIVWSQLQDIDDTKRGLLDSGRQPKRSYEHFSVFKNTLLK